MISVYDQAKQELLSDLMSKLNESIQNDTTINIKASVGDFQAKLTEVAKRSVYQEIPRIRERREK